MGCGRSTPVVSQEALAVDKDQDGTISKEELASFVERNAKLYAMLSVNLNLPEQQCRNVATDVAFAMCKKSSEVGSLRDLDNATLRRDPSVQEFQAFLTFLDDPSGQKEFFQRTVFSTFDVNHDGYLELNELDSFLDIFYQAGSIFAGDLRLPTKDKLKRQVMKKLDTNKDGKLQFSEMSTLISGDVHGLLQPTHKTKNDANKTKIRKKNKSEGNDNDNKPKGSQTTQHKHKQKRRSQ
mmetsp:Transcript_16868/g.19008  ORF Transcript_16868/g.19008 Transcript_16868/m.19008 type:complete len:238 (-) Transcript_16868:49-762(-)